VVNVAARASIKSAGKYANVVLHRVLSRLQIAEKPEFDVRIARRCVHKLYSPLGRSPIPPEKLRRVLWLQVLYTLKSERC
jgi:hypothetical protein